MVAKRNARGQVQQQAARELEQSEPVDQDSVKLAANREVMLCYIRGDFVPREARVLWDLRNVPIVNRVKEAMLRDGATKDKAAAYLDAELARR